MHKLLAFSVCLWRFLTFKTIHFCAWLPIIFWRDILLQIKTLLTDSFVVIGQSFRIFLLAGVQEVGRPVLFLPLIVIPSCIRIDSSSGVTFYFKVIDSFGFFHLWNQNVDPSSKLFSLVYYVVLLGKTSF